MIKYNNVVIMLIFAWCIFIGGGFMEHYVSQGLFSRFASATVICALVSEYWLLKNEMHNLYSSLKGQGAAEAGNTGIKNIKPIKIHNYLQVTAHITIITGTFMWGFGDCIFSIEACIKNA